MFKALFLIFLSSLFMEASTLAKKYTLLAGSVDKNGTHIVAEDDVLISSKEYSFRADKAIYDVRSGDLALMGHVDVKFENQMLSSFDYTIFNLKTKTFSTQNLFAFSPKGEIWFDTQTTKGLPKHYLLRDTTISSCQYKDPEWKIRFSKGLYYPKEGYVSIYNPRFYINQIPILYLPWFGFSTNKERKSGFLQPIFGFENSENVFFVLPFYVAKDKAWDIELDPQIRLKRGVGLYSTFRFADSNHSSGEVNIGVFKNNKKYFKKHSLENRSHYGVGLKYKNESLLPQALKGDRFHDGLLIDATYLNDIDYVNLDHKTGRASSKLVTSKANYVYYGDKDFLGAYVKYFIDTEKKSNADTLQTLPSIQYHRFSQGLKRSNLLYSLDYKFKNNYRERGLNAKQHELSIPLIFHKTLVKEYLHFQASENFYYSRVNYTEGNATTKNANYFSNYHKLSLASDLTKQYKRYLHNLQLDVSMIIPSFEKKDGYFASFIPFNLETKSVAFKLNQYFYDFKGFNFFMHRLRQILYDDETLYKYSDLENQLIYRFSEDFVVHNTFFYSHEHKRMRKVQTGLDYKNSTYDVSFNHTYEYKPLEKNTNFITSRFGMKIDKNYDIFASLDYNIEDTFTKEWTAGWRMKKKCWDYMFRYKESVTPNLTSSGSNSLKKRGVLLYVRFSPFGGMKYNYNNESPLNLENLEGIK